MEFSNYANFIAMAFSFIGVIMLGKASVKMGGAIGKTLKIIVAGIFLSVFVHSGFELAASMGKISEETLLPVMGVLLSLGSIGFAYAGYKTLNDLK